MSVSPAGDEPKMKNTNLEHKDGAETGGSMNSSTSKGKKDYYRKSQERERQNFFEMEQENKIIKKKNEKQRSYSTTATKDERSNNMSKQRHSSTGKNFSKRSSNSITSTDGCEYNAEMDLDEPFSDSDDDTFSSKGTQKMYLPIPRGRIRTLSGTVPAVGFSPKWGGPTMCFSCLQFFDLPDMMVEFASHLLSEHCIVVVEMDLIVDPKRYVEYWRQRFAKESIDKIFPKVYPVEGDPLFGITSYYFEMCEKLPEDYSLRQRLAMRRLEEALACQQREREDTSFLQQCIFCRYTARGNRSKIIHHLYMIHHLNLGSPDNLVFVTEYIEHLKMKLVNNQCIYCEKLFVDRNALMEHMRKRNHREVNPKNNYYDKFYIINYLELGKRWLDVLAEDFEDTMHAFVDSDEEEEQDSWHEWQEDNLDEDQMRVLCLFCDTTHDSIESLIKHFKEQHHVDILNIIEKEQLDVYGRIKMINYIRKQNYNLKCFVCLSQFESQQALKVHQSGNEHLAAGLPSRDLWDLEENLIPIFCNDHLLWMLESYFDEKALSANDVAEKTNKRAIMEILVEESIANTVKEVVAEDLPELRDCILSDPELYESLK